MRTTAAKASGMVPNANELANEAFFIKMTIA